MSSNFIVCSSSSFGICLSIFHHSYFFYITEYRFATPIFVQSLHNLYPVSQSYPNNVIQYPLANFSKTLKVYLISQSYSKNVIRYRPTIPVFVVTPIIKSIFSCDFDTQKPPTILFPSLGSSMQPHWLNSSTVSLTP
jgi:hypothetical protein